MISSETSFHYEDEKASEDDQSVNSSERDEVPNDSGISMQEIEDSESESAIAPQVLVPEEAQSAVAGSQRNTDSGTGDQRATPSLSQCSDQSSRRVRKPSHKASPVLDQGVERPVRVTKSRHRSLAKKQTHALPFVPVEEQTPSDEHILMVLIQRRQKMESNLSSAHAKVKTLQAYNMRLQQERADLDAQVHQLSTEHTKVTGRQESLVTELEEFKAKYYKLKDLAKCLNVGMIELGRDRDVQKQGINELLAEGRVHRAATHNAHTIIEKVDGKLDVHKRSFATAQGKLKDCSRSTEQLQKQLSSTTAQLMEERRRSERLETHITAVSGTQERLNKGLEIDCKTLIEWMRRINSRLGRVDSAISVIDTQLLTANTQRSCVLRELQQHLNSGLRPTAEEETALTTLQTLIKNNHASLSKTLENIPKEPQTAPFEALESSIVGVMTAIQGLQPDMDSSRQIHITNAGLTAKVQAKDNEIAALKHELAAHQSNISEAVSACHELAKQSKSKKSDDAPLQSALIKYQQASSKLAKREDDLNAAREEKQKLEHEVVELREKLRQGENDHKRRSEQVQQEHMAAVSSQQTCFDVEVNKLQKEIVQLKTAKIEGEGQLKKVSAEAIKRTHALSVLQSKHDSVTAETKQLRQSKDNLSNSIEDSIAQNKMLQQQVAQLESTKAQSEATAQEAQRLKPFEEQCATLKIEVDGLKHTLTERSQKITNQTKALRKLEADADQISSLQRAIMKLKETDSSLAKNLEEAQGQADQLPELRDQIALLITEKSALEVETEKLQPLQDQLSAVNEDKARIAGELEKIRISSAKVQQQLDASADAWAQVTVKDGLIALLQRHLAEATEAQADLALLQEESSRKDSQLTILTNQLKRLTADSQAIEHEDLRISYEGNKAVSDILSQTSQQIMRMPDLVADQLINSQDLPSDLPRRHVLDSQERPPARRVADRSANARSLPMLPSQEKLKVEETQQHSEGISIVPDSQELILQPLKHVEEPRNDNSSTSSLSELDDSDDRWLDRGMEMHVARPVSGPGHDGSRQVPVLLNHPPAVARPSSSAMSEDLFRKHADGVGDSQHESYHAHGPLSASAPKQPVIPAEDHLRMPPPFVSSQPDLSPNRLRGGRVHGDRSTTQPQGPASPPADLHVRPQPNSAIKRSIEDDSPSSGVTPTKRRKRKLEDTSNERAIIPSSSQSRSVAKGAPIGRLRMSSDAAAPGKNLRKTSTRTASRNDKYKNRFGS